jgi:hypothetical protein
VAIPTENVALTLDEGINASKSHLVRKEKVVEEGRKMPTVSGKKLTFLILMVISTSRTSLIGFSR